MPRLPRETKEDVLKCHACHAKRRWLSPSATPTTQNEGGCRRVPLLPRKVPRHHRRPSRPSAPRSAISATPATQNEGECLQVRCLPRKTKVDGHKCHACHAKCHKCHACLAKRRWMSPSATPATQMAGGCRRVPRLPRKTKVDVTKCHACHVKRRWMSPSATPVRDGERWCVKDGG